MQRQIIRVLGLCACLASASPAATQWLKQPTPDLPRRVDGSPNLTAPAPRMPDGKPDLSGLWRYAGSKYILNVASDFPPDNVPFQPWAERLYRERQTKDDPAMRCLPLGLPRFFNSPFKLIQTRSVIAVLYEIHTLYRQIFLDRRPLPIAPNPTWFGYSVGHWEGDALVVESTGFNDKSWLDLYGHPHSEALHLSERYVRTSVGQMNVRITIDDPQAYTRPWTIVLALELMPDTEMIETICENQGDILPHLVENASHPADRHTVTVNAEFLAEYAGSYRQFDQNVVITATADHLLVKLPGNPELLPFFAESPTRFFSTVNPVVVDFERGPDGHITSALVHLVGSDRRLPRNP